MLSHFAKIEALTKSFDPPTQAALSALSTVQQYKKGQLLLRKGQVCRKSYHIVDGIARKFLATDHKETTTEFYFADDLAIAFGSYVFQQPSREYIECLTDVTAEVTGYDAFQRAKAQFPGLLALDLLLTELHAGWLEECLFDAHTLNATERYEKLLAQAPHLVQHCKLTHIASYLGISLETLSRIRAKK